jgi:putative transposase
MCHNLKMATKNETPTYKRFRFPIEVIQHAVWLYFRFSLSYRDVELLLAERGLIVSYETIRQWCLKFGKGYARKLRRRRGQPGDKWHIDEVFIKINGKTHYLWRAVDQEGIVLDILVTRRRNKEAAKQFFLKLLQGLEYEPRVIITDKLRSYGAALREVLPHVEHRQHKGLNNRAENSHRPTRRREKVMQRFKSMDHAHQFLPSFSLIYEHFKPKRHLMKAADYRKIIVDRFDDWHEVTAVTSC